MAVVVVLLTTALMVFRELVQSVSSGPVTLVASHQLVQETCNA